MRTPKRIAIAVSGLALAGSTALTLGAALPASAQTTPKAAVSTSTSHLVNQWGWGWDDDWGWGWDGGWGWGGFGFDDCF